MFKLTRQEQLMIAILMFALIVGSFVRLYRAADSSQKETVATSAPSEASH
jgi:hypothetical protein